MQKTFISLMLVAATILTTAVTFCTKMPNANGRLVPIMNADVGTMIDCAHDPVECPFVVESHMHAISDVLPALVGSFVIVFLFFVARKFCFFCLSDFERWLKTKWSCAMHERSGFFSPPFLLFDALRTGIVNAKIYS